MKVVSQFNQKSSLVEAYRILRTNLNFATEEKPVKFIMITSAEPGEGKSSVAANLGVVMAQSGKKVVIVDCDLRKPKQHEIFGLDNAVGLSDILNNKMQPDQVAKKTQVPNLAVITSGPCPANPAELVDSPGVKETLQMISRMADVVLVDSPPVLAVSETLMLAALVEGVILVIKSSVTQQKVLKRAKKLLEKTNVVIIGAVLNEVKSHYNHYYHSAGYDADEAETAAAGHR